MASTIINRLPVSALLSPPETKKHDTFATPMSSIATFSKTPSSSFESNTEQHLTVNALRTISANSRSMESLPLSPPISPFVSNQKDTTPCSPGGNGIRDPPLFPSSELAPEVPLFPTPSKDPVAPELAAVVESHIAKRKAYLPSAASPTRDEYLLAVSCVPVVAKAYNRNPMAWLKRERQLLAERYGAIHRVQKPKSLATYKKLAPAPAQRKPKPATESLRLPRAPRQPKQSPAAKSLDSFDGSPLSRPMKAITTRDDVDYNALPDYSPPLSTLPLGNKVLKADWKGQVLDLSHDPDRHLLHEAEVNLAATLRLSCATYLCSKRRIFQARIDALRIGKEFRKTDAQQACKIDVNKASKLWSAYEKVGWFRKEFFEQYL